MGRNHSSNVRLFALVCLRKNRTKLCEALCPGYLDTILFFELDPSYPGDLGLGGLLHSDCRHKHIHFSLVHNSSPLNLKCKCTPTGRLNYIFFGMHPGPPGPNLHVRSRLTRARSQLPWATRSLSTTKQALIV
jgi:hypothetical protein